ncbi:MAG: hypothetical protein PHN53_11365 [Eubacteriales bacterium]|nr:hypothetical protein [Eubacteriales bacterium]
MGHRRIVLAAAASLQNSRDRIPSFIEGAAAGMLAADQVFLLQIFEKVRLQDIEHGQLAQDPV